MLIAANTNLKKLITITEVIEVEKVSGLLT